MLGMESTAHRRMASMDGLRGFAAILVLLYHAQQCASSPVTLPSSYLAVDLFFMLSGFVVALAYEGRLLAGNWFWPFVRARLMRLYPLAMLGTVLGAAAIMVPSNWQTGTPWQVRAVASGLPLAAAFIPRLGQAHALAFPLNPPMWSLFFEIWINIAFAACLPLLTNRRLLLISGVGAIGVVVTSLCLQTLDAGSGGLTFLGGLARVCWSFPVGVLIYRFHSAGRFRGVPKTPGWVLMIVTLASCTPPTLGLWSAIAACISVILIFPMIVVASIYSRQSDVEEQVFKQVGDLSYALYALHFPVLMLCGTIEVGAVIAREYVYAGAAIMSVPIAFAASKYFDTPARHILKRMETIAIRRLYDHPGQRYHPASLGLRN